MWKKLKAKIRAWLYDKVKPEYEPCKIIRVDARLKECEVSTRISQEVADDCDEIEKIVVRELADRLEPYIANNLEAEKDIYTNTYAYRVKVWFLH